MFSLLALGICGFFVFGGGFTLPLFRLRQSLVWRLARPCPACGAALFCFCKKVPKKQPQGAAPLKNPAFAPFFGMSPVLMGSHLPRFENAFCGGWVLDTALRLMACPVGDAAPTMQPTKVPQHVRVGGLLIILPGSLLFRLGRLGRFW